MNHFISGVAQAAFETFDFPGPIMEVGSYQVEGQEEIAELRQFFPGKEYHGIDIRQGPGVDSVENIEKLERPDNSVGSVIALNVFEHVKCFWKGFAEIQRVLRPDGIFFVSCPFYFRVHHYPSDYWRFTPESFRALLEDYPNKIIGYHGPVRRPLHVWAIATGSDYPPITREQHQKFHTLIHQYAKQPVAWNRKWRYLLGQMICGKGIFSPKLQGEQFDTQLINAA